MKIYNTANASNTNRFELNNLDLGRQHGQTILAGKIIERKVLCNEENHRVVMIRMEIDNPKNEMPAQFAPGDHAVVYPTHSDAEVDFVMEHLTKKPSDPNTSVDLYEYNKNEGKARDGCRF